MIYFKVHLIQFTFKVKILLDVIFLLLFLMNYVIYGFVHFTIYIYVYVYHMHIILLQVSYEFGFLLLFVILLVCI